MDYNDSENPAGASPWGNSPQASPRHNRTDFGSIGGEPPAFPRQSTNNGSSTEQDDGGFGGEQADYRRPDTASSTVSGPESRTDENEPLGAQQQREQPRQTSQEHQQQRPAQDFQAKHAGGQAHGQHGQDQQQQQQHRRQTQHQFKLQAKITGLERTGRKDPILRFDVHVRQRT